MQTGSDRTRALAAHFYIDETILEQEKRDLFFKSWQFVCHASQLDAPGKFTTFSLFDQNVFLVRDRGGDIQGFYNVCPHRGHKLVEGSGQKSRITCPYHSWTFNHDGSLVGAKGIKKSGTIDKSGICLFKVQVDQVLDFVFVNLDPHAGPLAEFAPGLEEQILSICPDIQEIVLDVQGHEFGHTYQCASNWKVMLDNYLECYHCQMAHPDFDDMMDISASKFTLHQNYTHQVAPTAFKAENKAFSLDLEHDVLVGNFWFLFPNMTLGQFPGVKGFYISRFDPITPHETLRTSTVLVPAAPTDSGAQGRDQARARWTTEVVAREDQALCENVQKGMRQMGFKEGWYMTAPEDHGISEHAMRYFHDLYLEAME